MSLVPVAALPSLPTTVNCSAAIRETLRESICGSVAEVIGPVIRGWGMQPTLGAICRIESQRRSSILARVIGFQQDAPLLAPLEEASGIRAGDKIHVVDHSLRIGIGEQLCGRVIDALGRPLDQRPLPPGLRIQSVETAAPLPLERPPIRQAMATGVRAIDGLLTCGFGQRLGIFAGSGVGKSTLLSMLAKGTTADAVVIGLVGERSREVREFLEVALGEKGLARSVVVVATSDQPATLRIQAAWTATAIAETLRDAGKNVMLILDSVTRLALAQRELGLAAREPPTTRGFPPSVFQLLPKLVERAGRTETGSITAFYSVLVEGDDMNDPVADTLRGLLDGHLVLSRSLAESGHYPAIDILASLSRLQPYLVSKETSQAALVVRNRLAEYRRHEDLISVGAYRPGSNPLLDAAIQSRDAIRQFLMQGSEPLPFESTLTQLRQLAAPPPLPSGGSNLATNNGK